MTISENTHRLDEILEEMPNYIFNYLKLSDEINKEWRKGFEVSDYGGHYKFKAKYKQAIQQLIDDVKKDEYERGWHDAYLNIHKSTGQEISIREYKLRNQKNEN